MDITTQRTRSMNMNTGLVGIDTVMG